MDDFIIALQAGIDEAKSAESINKNDIPKLQKKLDTLKLQATIDKKSLKEIASQLEKFTGKKFSVSNIGIDTKQAGKDGKKYGKDFSKSTAGAINSDAAEQINKISDASTATIVSNEKKKQEAYTATENIYKQISENESLIKNGFGSVIFDGTNNAAKDAQKYFNNILQNEKAIISTVEEFGNDNGLTSFIVNIQRANGEVESLKYAIDSLNDKEGNIEQVYYKLSGSSIGDAGVKKLLQEIENTFSDYTAKFAQFKNTNREILSGLSYPISDFEEKLNGLKSGAYTINDVKNSFKTLNTEASNIISNLVGKMSKIDAAIRNISKGEETITGLRAEFNGLNHTPKDINIELDKLSASLQSIKEIESQEGRTANWAEAYREWEKQLIV